MKTITERYYTPKHQIRYKGKFIVFFSEKLNPRVLFSSILAQEAYKKAEEITAKTKKLPIVMYIPTYEHI